MTAPYISCVCPTHGRGYLIGEAVESYCRQELDGVPTELLLFNDCPEQPLACDVPGVRCVNLPVPITDLSDKFNAAVQEARGEWVAWWEDDDISLPFRLRDSLRLAQSTGKQYVKQSHALCWNNGAITHWHGNALFFGNSFFRRDYYLQCGGAAPGKWADLGGHECMERGGSYHCQSPMLGETWFVYRWAGIGVHHDSAVHQGTNADRFRAFRARTLADPRFVPGVCNVRPAWSQDYPAQVVEYIAQTGGPQCKPS